MFVLNHAGEICFFSMLLCISRLADSETESVSERECLMKIEKIKLAH